MTNDGVLKFSSHDFGVLCYGVSDVNIEYAKSALPLAAGRVLPEKRAEDAKRTPNGTAGPYSAFQGPVTAKWSARDGTKLEASIDLDRVFPERVVLHTQEAGRIYKPDPIVASTPTVVVELDNRTVNVYMVVTLRLVKDAEQKTFDIKEEKTLAFTQTY